MEFVEQLAWLETVQVVVMVEEEEVVVLQNALLVMVVMAGALCYDVLVLARRTSNMWSR